MQIGLLKQREFITLLGGAASASMTRPYMAHGQTNRVRRVGILLAGSENDLEFRAQISALKKGLQELGWTEGRNVRFEYRWLGDDPARGLTRFIISWLLLATVVDVSAKYWT